MQNFNIDIKPSQKVWFTSDQHFGHRNIIQYCNRPFADTFAMDNWIINSWNEVVSDNDIVFILGDITMFPDAHKIKKYLDQLKGKEIYIIPGNHDKVEKGFRLLDGRYKICHDIVQVMFNNGIKVQLSHCPLMTWPGRDKRTYHFYGHIHSGPRSSGYDSNLPFYSYMYDVGVDNNDFYPIELNDIIKKLTYEFVRL